VNIAAICTDRLGGINKTDIYIYRERERGGREGGSQEGREGGREGGSQEGREGGRETATGAEARLK
jgi:hypothetical protein